MILACRRQVLRLVEGSGIDALLAEAGTSEAAR